MNKNEIRGEAARQAAIAELRRIGLLPAEPTPVRKVQTNNTYADAMRYAPDATCVSDDYSFLLYNS